MKLEIFTRKGVIGPGIVSKRPFITLNKNGVFRLNRLAGGLLQLTEGDSVEIAQDADNKADWFICKSTTGQGFVIRKYGKRWVHIFQCRDVQNRILASLQITLEGSHSFSISTEPLIVDTVKYYKFINAQKED